jgi:hypothetical protein
MPKHLTDGWTRGGHSAKMLGLPSPQVNLWKMSALSSISVESV